MFEYAYYEISSDNELRYKTLKLRMRENMMDMFLFDFVSIVIELFCSLRWKSFPKCVHLM